MKWLTIPSTVLSIFSGFIFGFSITLAENFTPSFILASLLALGSLSLSRNIKCKSHNIRQIVCGVVSILIMICFSSQNDAIATLLTLFLLTYSLKLYNVDLESLIK